MNAVLAPTWNKVYHQTFNEAQVTSDSAYGANRESLSAFVEDFETSISIDFPEDEEYVGEVLDCGSSDISIHGRTEEAQHADEKDDRNSSIPEVVITQADEEREHQDFMNTKRLKNQISAVVKMKQTKVETSEETRITACMRSINILSWYKLA
ncbi:unnamed protein product [Lepidochelys kempii]